MSMNENEERLAMPFLSERILNLTKHKQQVLHAFTMASRLRETLANSKNLEKSEVARADALADAIALYHRIEELKDFEFIVEWQKVGAIRCPQCECR